MNFCQWARETGSHCIRPWGPAGVEGHSNNRSTGQPKHCSARARSPAYDPFNYRISLLEETLKRPGRNQGLEDRVLHLLTLTQGQEQLLLHGQGHSESPEPGQGWLTMKPAVGSDSPTRCVSDTQRRVVWFGLVLK